MNYLVPVRGEAIEDGNPPENGGAIGFVQRVFFPDSGFDHGPLSAIALEGVPYRRPYLPFFVMNDEDEQLKKFGVGRIPREGNFADPSCIRGSLSWGGPNTTARGALAKGLV